MESNESSETKKITKELMCKWIVGWIAFGIIYNVLYEFIISMISSTIVNLIISIIFEGILVLTIWKICINSTLKGRKISKEDIVNIMRSLLIFIIIICVINVVYNIYILHNSIETVQSMVDAFGGDTRIEDLKRQAYIYSAIGMISKTVIFLGSLPFAKKELLEKVE